MGFRRPPKVKIDWSKLGDNGSLVYRQLRDIVQSARISQLSISFHGVQQTKPSTETQINSIRTTTRLPRDPPAPATSTRSLVPHWSYEKSSIAAACIFTTIVFAAVCFLVFLSIKRLRRKWIQYHHEKPNETPPRNLQTNNARPRAHPKPDGGSTRNRIMSARDRSPSQPYIVEQKGRSTSRTIRQCRDRSTPSPIPAGDPTPPKKALQKKKTAPARKTQSAPGPRHVVMMPPPLKHVVSMKAKVDGEPSDGRSHSSLSKVSSAAETQEEEHASRKSSEEGSLLRLPSLQQSNSPIF